MKKLKGKVELIKQWNVHKIIEKDTISKILLPYYCHIHFFLRPFIHFIIIKLLYPKAFSFQISSLVLDIIPWSQRTSFFLTWLTYFLLPRWGRGLFFFFYWSEKTNAASRNAWKKWESSGTMVITTVTIIHLSTSNIIR